MRSPQCCRQFSSKNTPSPKTANSSQSAFNSSSRLSGRKILIEKCRNLSENSRSYLSSSDKQLIILKKNTSVASICGFPPQSTEGLTEVKDGQIAQQLPKSTKKKNQTLMASNLPEKTFHVSRIQETFQLDLVKSRTHYC